MTLDVVDRLRGTPETDYKLRTSAELDTMREQLRTAQDSSYQEMKRITEKANGRPLTQTQRSDYDAAERRCEDAGSLLEMVHNALAHRSIDFSQVQWQRGDGHPGAALERFGSAYDMLVGSPDRYVDDRPLRRSQTFTGYARSRGQVQPQHEELDLGRFLTGMVTGRWDSGSEMERRALSEGVQSAGGYLVPTILSSMIIDLARPDTQVLAAGAQLMPMANQIVDVAKWAGDPSSAWHTELATITPTDATIGKVALLTFLWVVITPLSGLGGVGRGRRG